MREKHLWKTLMLVFIGPVIAAGVGLRLTFQGIILIDFVPS